MFEPGCNPASLIAALQHSDSAFPSGGFAFSWGLEGLAADELVQTPKDLAEVIEEQLVHRWNRMDRVLLRRAHQAADTTEIGRIDREAEAATFSEAMRVGSRRAGRLLLGVCGRLEQSRAVEYRKLADADPRLGHLCVMQGMIYKDAGLTLGMSELVSGWTMMSGMTSAAVRLNIVGHLDAQLILTALRPKLAHLISSKAGADTVSSFGPLLDIAMSRNPGRQIRMFAT